MLGCDFCLENNSLRGEILEKNNLAYFTNSGSKVLQHSGLIIPFRHVETPFLMTDEEWLAIKELLLFAKSHYDTERPDGYNIGWNVGAVGGQHVFHAHLHIIARFADEPMAGKGIRSHLKTPQNTRLTEMS